jgi:lipoprotein NlpD
MVIVKHNDTFLTAYAHNQKILVKEKDSVRQGQQIAEMGKSGTDRVKLHFEVRKQGVAVDPQPYLDGKAR